MNSCGYFRLAGSHPWTRGIQRFVAVLIVGLASIAMLGSSISTASAHFDERMLQFGAALAKWTNGSKVTKDGQLSINGLPIHRASIISPLGVKESLDQLELACSQRGGIANAEQLLASPAKALPHGATRLLRGIYRHDSVSTGVLACIETGHPLSISETTQRLGDFLQSGNLSSVGKLRYVLARREQDTTFLLALWTESDAPLLHIFPRTGDAPGTDAPNLPRPKGSVRTLSVTDATSPYALRIYRSPQLAVEEVYEQYERALHASGWRFHRGKSKAIVGLLGSHVVVIHAYSSSSSEVTTSIVSLC